MSNVKEFDVTEGFLNLGEEVTECQDQESFEECNTREYLQLARRKCGCTPFSLSHLNDTVSRRKIELFFYNDFFQENICSPSGLDCFRQIRLSQMCLPSCRGLYLDINVDKNVPSIESYPEFQPAYESYLRWKKGIKL